MPASLSDVARLVQVSISTVSRALHRPEMVDADTRARVQAAVDALGYVPQGVGRALVSRQTHTVGAVIAQIGASAFAKTIEALRGRLGQAGYTLLLAQPQQADPAHNDPLRALIGRGIDAAVLLGGPCPDAWRDLVRKSRMPLVTIWADAASAQDGDVGFDNYQAGRQAAEHLLSLGHRDFAMISGVRQHNERAARRYLGVLETVAAAGGRLAREHVIETEYGFANGHAAAGRLLARGGRFSAIVCGNDYLAIGVLAALREQGIQVPGDVSVIGFNDTEFSPFACPPLTTVALPSADIGQRAAEALLHALEHHGKVPAPIMLPTGLVARASTGRYGAPTGL